MGRCLCSLNRRIRNAVATWLNFALKSEEKQKQSPSVAIFLQPNWNENKKNKVFNPSLCNFYPLNQNEDENKKVLVDGFIVCGFVVRYLFFCAIYFFVQFLTDAFE